MSPRFISDETFVELKTLRGLPSGVKDEFVKLTNDHTFMADANESFAFGCIRSEGELSRRLIFAGINSKHCLLFYEKGGYGLQSIVAAFELNGKVWKLIWKGYPNLESETQIKTLGELQKLFKTSKTYEVSDI